MMLHYFPFNKQIKKKHFILGTTYALFGALFGSIGIVVIKFFDYMPGIQIAGLWLFFGSFISFLLNYLNDGGENVKKILKTKKKYIALQTTVSTLTAYFLITGITLLNPGTASFINSTIFITSCFIIGVYLFKDTLSKKQIIAIAGTIIGLFVIAYQNFYTGSYKGILFVTLAAFFLSATSFIVKKFFEPEEALSLNAIRSFFGGLSLLLIVLFSQTLIIPPLNVLPLFIIGMVCGNVLQFFFQYKAYDLEKLEIVSAIQSTAPVFVTILALIFLKILPSYLEIIGGGIMLISAMNLIFNNKT
jgi:drug/metabolite transporter (DMT)-like permease